MENTEIINRIKFLISELRLKQNSFARRINTDISNFSKHLNGKLPIGDTLINRIVVNFGVSKTWLLTGEGIPFPKTEVPKLVVSNLDSAEKGSPVYDIDVTAGCASREMLFADDRIVGNVDVPGVPLDCKIVRVSGDSMSPVINNGDYIAVREIRDMSVLYWGQIYVVLLEDYRMVKYLRRHSDPEKIILKSENPQYDDIELLRSQVRGLFFVTNIIHIDTRM